MVDENITNDMDDAVEPIIPIEPEPESSTDTVDCDPLIENCDDDDEDNDDIDEDEDDTAEA